MEEDEGGGEGDRHQQGDQQGQEQQQAEHEALRLLGCHRQGFRILGEQAGQIPQVQQGEAGKQQQAE
ncbi:hypothetical protein D3C71_2203880 [compost metagenome]